MRHDLSPPLPFPYYYYIVLSGGGGGRRGKMLSRSEPFFVRMYLGRSARACKQRFAHEVFTARHSHLNDDTSPRQDGQTVSPIFFYFSRGKQWKEKRKVRAAAKNGAASLRQLRPTQIVPTAIFILFQSTPLKTPTVTEPILCQLRLTKIMPTYSSTPYITPTGAFPIIFHTP